MNDIQENFDILETTSWKTQETNLESEMKEYTSLWNKRWEKLQVCNQKTRNIIASQSSSQLSRIRVNISPALKRARLHLDGMISELESVGTRLEESSNTDWIRISEKFSSLRAIIDLGINNFSESSYVY